MVDLVGELGQIILSLSGLLLQDFAQTHKTAALMNLNVNVIYPWCSWQMQPNFNLCCLLDSFIKPSI